MKRTAICFGGVIILLCVLVPMMSYATQIFLVRGLVTDANENPIDGLDVTVENTSRSIPAMTVRTGEESGNGIYSVLFFNFSKTVAESGDEIQITVAQEGEVLAEVTHILTDDDITASGAVIDIQIESRVPAPILNSVVSDSGIITGGTIVRLLGENLQEGTSVTVGGNKILEVDYVSPTELTFTVPEEAAGLVEIVLTNPDGQSATIEFTYVEFLPEDINRDGDIDIFDLVQVGSRFGDTGEGLAADIDRNGVVDIFDLVRVARQFGKSIKVSAAPSIHAEGRRFDYSSARQGFKQVDAHGRTTAMDSDISRRLQMALTELERISNVMPEVRFGADLLRRWMIANAGIPTKTQLLPNYPNPFNPETWIAYHLARDADVTLSIYDTRGAMVRQFDLGHQSAGFYTDRGHAIYWDGYNERGESVASGAYFYQLKAGDYTSLRRMVIAK